MKQKRIVLKKKIYNPITKRYYDITQKILPSKAKKKIKSLWDKV